MFVRDHLAVVAHWARDQLRDNVNTLEQGLQLRQLIDAADALRAQLEPNSLRGENVVSIDAFRRRARQQKSSNYS
jgi:hypothetical protein